MRRMPAYNTRHRKAWDNGEPVGNIKVTPDAKPRIAGVAK
jgi:hypothetical protein